MPSLVGISSESTSIPNNHRSYKAETPLNPMKPACGRQAAEDFYSRKDAKPQRKARLLQLSALGKFQFIATEEQYANRKSSLNSPFAPEEQYHFFAQRNNGPLGMTSGAICYLSRRITGACSAAAEDLFFSFFLLAKTPSRKEIVVRSV